MLVVSLFVRMDQFELLTCNEDFFLIDTQNFAI